MSASVQEIFDRLESALAQSDRVEVSRGVVDMRSAPPVCASSVQEAASWAVEAASLAASRGTFGVGGVLLGPERELMALSCNRVVHQGAVEDPTAHGERQLIDWYFQKVYDGEPLPASDRCTIVSSLDPCVMCAGSILSSGFQVVSATLDLAAGINCHSDICYRTLTKEFRVQAQSRFAYLGVEGRRDYQGPAHLGSGLPIPAALDDRSRKAFLDSLEGVQKLVHESRGAVDDLKSCSNQTLLSNLRLQCPGALTVTTSPMRPGVELAEPLLAAARRSLAQGGSYNSAALIDPYGNLVFLATGREDISPIRTAFMELTRGWAGFCAQAGPQAEKYLAHLKDCTVITLQGPGPDQASFMELGAYGSSVEGPIGPSAGAKWQYVLARQRQAELEATLAALPPFYSEVVKLRIEQVEDSQLKEWCSR